MRDRREPRRVRAVVGDADRDQIGDPLDQQPGQPPQPLLHAGLVVEGEGHLRQQLGPPPLDLGPALQPRPRQRLAAGLGHPARGVAIGRAEAAVLVEGERHGPHDVLPGHERQRDAGAEAPPLRLRRELGIALPPAGAALDPDRPPLAGRVRDGRGGLERHALPAPELAVGEPVARERGQVRPHDLEDRGRGRAEQGAGLLDRRLGHLVGAGGRRQGRRRLLQQPLTLGGLSALAEQAGVVQGEAGPVRHLLHERQLVLPQAPVAVCHEQQSAEGAPSRREGRHDDRPRRPPADRRRRPGVHAGGPHVGVEQLRGDLRHQRRLSGAGDARHSPRIVGGQRRPAAKLIDGALQLRLARRVGHHLQPAVGVGHVDGAQVPDPVRQDSRQRLEPLLDLGLLAEGRHDVGEQARALFAQTPRVHVDADPHHPREAGLGEHRRAPVEDPAVRAVVAEQPVLHLERSARLERAAVDAEAALEVVRMHALGPAVAELLLHRAPAELQPPAVEVGAASRGLGHPHQRRRRVRDGPEALLLDGVGRIDARRHRFRVGCLARADQPLLAGGAPSGRRETVSPTDCPQGSRAPAIRRPPPAAPTARAPERAGDG